MINFSKSLITFSPNVDPATKTDIQNWLGLDSGGQNHDKYLALPSFMGEEQEMYF